ncbi:MAG TPA: hypothetical protein VHL09_09195 [Dehalococcoidia bacterium]|nr:hypothetical protein [Dehalococcoidia bacterium]
MNQVERKRPTGLPVPLLSELRAKSDLDLVDLHDQIASVSLLNPSYILDELARREHYRQTKAILNYTRVISILVIIVALFATIALVVTILALAALQPVPDDSAPSAATQAGVVADVSRPSQ